MTRKRACPRIIRDFCSPYKRCLVRGAINNNGPNRDFWVLFFCHYSSSIFFPHCGALLVGSPVLYTTWLFHAFQDVARQWNAVNKLIRYLEVGWNLFLHLSTTSTIKPELFAVQCVYVYVYRYNMWTHALNTRYQNPIYYICTTPFMINVTSQ